MNCEHTVKCRNEDVAREMRHCWLAAVMLQYPPSREADDQWKRRGILTCLPERVVVVVRFLEVFDTEPSQVGCTCCCSSIVYAGFNLSIEILTGLPLTLILKCFPVR